MRYVITRFRELHESGCFVIPNPWDPGSAVYLHRLGFKALATTSSGFAFSRGMPDNIRYVRRDTVLKHFEEIVNATPLPVNGDFQNGHADDPEGVAENVALCIQTGVAGLSIEDSTGDERKPLYDLDLAIERIKAARRAIDESGIPVVLTARCEAWLVGEANPFETAIKRLTAYAEAGADCLFAPTTVPQTDEISAIVQAVAPKPVNVLISRPYPNMTVAHLADLGVRRISVGSGLARAAWGAFIRAARELHDEGTFEAFADSASGTDLNNLFR